MHRSSSNTRVADELFSSSSSPPQTSSVDANSTGNSQLPVYNPTSLAAKKERLRLRSAENVVHLIPVVLVLCAVILWLFSNPVDIVNNGGSMVARNEKLKAAGAVDVDGTQSSMLPHMEPDDVDLTKPVKDTKQSR